MLVFKIKPEGSTIQEQIAVLAGDPDALQFMYVFSASIVLAAIGIALVSALSVQSRFFPLAVGYFWLLAFIGLFVANLFSVLYLIVAGFNAYDLYKYKQGT